MVTLGCQHLSTNEFCELLRSSPGGVPIVYFSGDLAKHVAESRKAGDPNAPELRALARLVSELSDLDQICLTQKRIAEGWYQYRATKVRPEFRPEPRKQPQRQAA
jgi:hypothetical protein